LCSSDLYFSCRPHPPPLAGNYNCLAPLGHLGFFANPREYYLELGRHILLFYDTVDFFNEDLITLAIQVRTAAATAAVSGPAGHPPAPCCFPLHATALTIICLSCRFRTTTPSGLRSQ
jgi:hypothetical protein